MRVCPAYTLRQNSTHILHFYMRCYFQIQNKPLFFYVLNYFRLKKMHYNNRSITDFLLSIQITGIDIVLKKNSLKYYCWYYGRITNNIEQWLYAF